MRHGPAYHVKNSASTKSHPKCARAHKFQNLCTPPEQPTALPGTLSHQACVSRPAGLNEAELLMLTLCGRQSLSVSVCLSLSLFRAVQGTQSPARPHKSQASSSQAEARNPCKTQSPQSTRTPKPNPKPTLTPFHRNGLAASRTRDRACKGQCRAGQSQGKAPPSCRCMGFRASGLYVFRRWGLGFRVLSLRLWRIGVCALGVLNLSGFRV